MLRTILIMGAAIVVVAACAASSGAGGPDAAPSVAAPDTSSEPAAGGDVSLPAEITNPILADAATRLGVDPSAVTIVSAHAETFSDGSLGCPEPDMMYTQAIVDGYQVIVEANGTQVDYRGSVPGQFRLCENP